MKIIIKDKINNDITENIVIEKIENNKISYLLDEEEYIWEIIESKKIKIIKVGQVSYNLFFEEKNKTSNFMKLNNLEFFMNIFTKKIEVLEKKIYLSYDIFDNEENILSSYEITLKFT